MSVVYENPRIISFDMGSRNLAVAHVEVIGPQQFKIKRWRMIDLGKHEARTATNNLILLLESELRWMRESGDPVVVELQPANGVCKTLSHCLQTYFYVADLDDKRAPKPRRFDFMRAGNKLKVDSALYDEMKPVTSTDRKKVSMALVDKYVGNGIDDAFYAQYAMEKYKQRTDMADAFAQACRWLQINNKALAKAYAAPKHKPSKTDGNAMDVDEMKFQDIDYDAIEFI